MLRAARAVYDWSMIDVAERAGLSVSAVYSAEGRGRRTLTLPEINALVTIFEREGIEFFDDAAGGFGIKIRQS